MIHVGVADQLGAAAAHGIVDEPAGVGIFREIDALAAAIEQLDPSRRTAGALVDDHTGLGRELRVRGTAGRQTEHQIKIPSATTPERAPVSPLKAIAKNARRQ